MVIGIGGCSNAGKSALADEIIAKLPKKKAIVICQDDYTIDEELIPNHYEHTDWEVPESIDIETYIQDVKDAIGKYDLIICEGLFTFWWDELNALYNRQVYLNLDKNEFTLRKAKDNRWGKEPGWYIRHIWDNHQTYGKIKHKTEEDIYINANLGVFDVDGIIKQLGL
jgi:uridine kinase